MVCNGASPQTCHGSQWLAARPLTPTLDGAARYWSNETGVFMSFISMTEKVMLLMVGVMTVVGAALVTFSMTNGCVNVFKGSTLTLGQMADAVVYVGADVDAKGKSIR